MRYRIYIIAAALSLLGSTACDDIEFQEGTTLPQSPVLQDVAARSRVSLTGIEELYKLRWAQGVPLDFDRRVVDTEFESTALGPLEENVEVTQWNVSVANNRTVLTAEVDNFDIVVPVRIEQGIGTRICRIRVVASRMDASIPINTRAVSDPSATSPEALTGLSAPTVTFSERATELIGSCPPLEESVALDGQLDTDIRAYVDDASADLVSRMAQIAPSQELGLLDTNVELAHITAFDNRRGSLSIFSQPNEGSAQLGDSGYAVDFDMAVDSFRASCTPPEPLDLPPERAPAPIPASVLDAADADAAYALSTRTISALAQNGVRAGFACIGLEDAPLSDTSEGAVSTDDLNLERVGLGELPVGTFAVPVLSPGDIPAITPDPGAGVISLSWSDLTIDIYAEVRDVPVRILQLTATFDFTLQPAQSRGNALALQIGSIEVSSADVTSQWRPDDAEIIDEKRWVRRLLLLFFEDRLQLPLPVEPGAPLELISTQVRSDDLLLLLRIDSRL